MKSKKFKGYLNYKGLTLQDVARDLGISLSTVYRRMELSCFTIADITRMRALYGFSSGDLLEIFFEDSPACGFDSGGVNG